MRLDGPFGLAQPAVRRVPPRRAAAADRRTRRRHCARPRRRRGGRPDPGRRRAAPPHAQRLHGARPPTVDGRAGPDHRAADRDAHRDASRRCCIPLAEVELRLPFEVGRLRRLLLLRAPRHQRRADLPARASRRCCRTGSTCRSATTAGPAPSWSPAPPVVRPCGQRQPRRRAPVFGPSARLDIEAEVGFVVGVPTALGRARAGGPTSPTTSSAWCWSTTGRPATSRPGSTSRSARSSASRSPPRSRRGWCRSTRSPPPGSPRRAQDPPVLRLPARRAAPGLRPAAGGRAGTAPVVSRPPFAAHVLDAGAAARAPDRQRRGAAHRRPVRLRHGLRPGARPGRLVPGADLGRRGAGDARGRAAAHVPARTATRSRSAATAPGPDGDR